MSFGQELKDFVSGFKAGHDMGTKAQDSEARRKYTDERTRALKLGNDEKEEDKGIIDKMSGTPRAPGGPVSRASTDTPGAKPTSGGSKDRESFIAEIMPVAQEVAKETGVDPRIIVAQAGLESNWGKSAPGNNLFGIKSHNRPGGTRLPTVENVGGKDVKTTGVFRAYKDRTESIRDYGRFLKSNPRYGAMLKAQGLEAQIAALGKSGYATDPNYGSKIASIAKGLPQPGGLPVRTMTAAAPTSGLPVQTTASQRPVAPASNISALPDSAVVPARRPDPSLAGNAPVEQGDGGWEEDEEVDDENDGYARGGMVKSYADGGFVSNDDPIEQDNGSYYRQEAERTQALPVGGSGGPAAAPTAPQPTAAAERPAPRQALAPTAEDGTPTPPPRPEDPIGRVIGGGLKAVQAEFTQPQQQGAIPAQGASNAGPARLFTTTEGSADPEDVRELEKIGGQKGMPPELARVNGMVRAYEYYESRGELAKADRMAASVLRYSQVRAQAFGEEAVAAYNAGDIKGAGQFVLQAFNQVPDGRHASLEGGKIVMRNMQGEVVGEADPPQPGHILEMAQAARDGSGFYRMLFDRMNPQRATRPTKEPVPPSEAFQRYQQGQGQPAPQGQPAATPAAIQSTPAPATPAGNEDVPDSFLAPKAAPSQGAAPRAAYGPAPSAPNTNGMTDKEATRVRGEYQAKLAEWRANKPPAERAQRAGAGPKLSEKITFNNLAKAVGEELDSIEEGRKDPKTGEGPKIPDADKSVIKSVGAALQRDNPSDAGEAARAAMTMIQVDPSAPTKLTFDAKVAKDGSAQVSIKNGPTLVLDPKAWKAVQTTIQRKQQDATKKAAEIKKAEGTSVKAEVGRIASGIGGAFADQRKQDLENRAAAKAARPDRRLSDADPGSMDERPPAPPTQGITVEKYQRGRAALPLSYRDRTR